MKYITEGLKPAAPLRYFEELTAIPRGSGGEGRVADYLCDFAQRHGLRFHRDVLHNVVIWKDGKAGAPPVMLQGHTDMVWAWDTATAPNADKYSNINKYFEGEGIHIVIENNKLRASGTSLGADNGVAVCYMLALLERDDDALPPLECVFTSQEETGLFGAAALDKSLLTSRRMINLDSAEQGVVTVSCAGGCRVNSCREFALKQSPDDAVFATLRVGGLSGGHSGIDAHRGRTNAIWLVCHIAQHMFLPHSAQVVSIGGGEADNAIPRSSELTLMFPSDAQYQTARAAFDAHPKRIDNEPEVFALLEPSPAAPYLDGGTAVVEYIASLPRGVQSRRDDKPNGFVVTSLNTGTAVTTADGDTAIVRLCTGLRSSDEAKMDDLRTRVTATATAHGFAIEQGAAYPGWAYREQSPLRNTLCATHRELFGTDMTMLEIHAGLECGLFTSAIHGLDVVAIGCTVTALHSPDECLDLDSFADTWRLLCATLYKLAD